MPSSTSFFQFRGRSTLSVVLVFALTQPVAATTFSEAFLNRVAGDAGPEVPVYTPLAPGELEVLDRVAPGDGGAYAPRSGNAAGELSASSPAQARKLSNALSTKDNLTRDAVPLSNLAVAMFQLLASHEIARSPTVPGEEIDIPLQPGDEAFFGNLNPLDMDRSVTTGGPAREQVNDVTSAFDGSTVYGSTEARKEMLWETDGAGDPTGFLKTSKTDDVAEPGDSDPNALPGLPKFMVQQGPTQVARAMSGDVRADENPTLQALHQVFILEHNRIAQIIADDCVGAGIACLGEQVFNAARFLVAETQKQIFYDEMLPLFLGTDELASLVPDRALIGDVEGALNSYTAAAGRLGHTQVPDTILLKTRNGGAAREVSLSECFFNRDCLGNATLEEILFGAAEQRAEAIDLVVADSLRNGQSPGFGADRNIDLLATNINRGRDHGIPDYLELRAALGFDQDESVDTILELLGLVPQAVLDAYGITTDADVLATPIDALVGLFGELRAPTDYLGETGRALWALQFLGLENGAASRFLAPGPPLAGAPVAAWFSAEQFLKGQTMASLLANNLGGTPESFGSAFVAPVPLPSALAMMVAALGGLVGIQRLRVATG